ncbi:hypothetical protein CALVIDRAFT_213885 [Calocera viscosa TUFC12733]|uniref:GPI inositol-deacylase n=1 Tax=Calocera viscosa (strain TUFC12733) TaxID=1330018 RepID=A0A167RDQ3_CALVF|nr:hypothetical protein CALVIDRAFT_213885 [Calocera viscosa TUFC12733]
MAPLPLPLLPLLLLLLPLCLLAPLLSSPFLRSPAFPGHTKPLDVYALDTSEELSAFSSSPLRARAEYAAAAAVAHILTLYPSPQPTEVLIIAHSMGGLVARLLLAHHPQAKVKNIIALSTPHAFRPLPISRELERVYALLPQGLPEEVMLLTVCGGAFFQLSDFAFMHKCRVISALRWPHPVGQSGL